MLGQKSMNPRDSDVIQAIGLIPHQLARQTGFLGHGEIRRACGDDQNGAETRLDIPLTKTNCTGERVKCRTGHESCHGFIGAFVCSRHEERLAMRDNGFGDGCDLFRCLALTEDDLWEPLPNGTVVIHASEAKIRHRCGAQIVEQAGVRVAGIERAAVDLVEEFPQLRRRHKGCFSLTLATAAVYR